MSMGFQTRLARMQETAIGSEVCGRTMNVVHGLPKRIGPKEYGVLGAPW